MNQTAASDHASRIQSVSVLGAGAWGTALATVAARAGRQVRLWARNPDLVQAIGQQRENAVYLPGVTLDAAITASTDMASVLRGAEAVLAVVPSQFLRAVLAQAAPLIDGGTPVVLGAKGVEAQTGYLMSEVAAEEMPDTVVGVLSGPTFAAEVARGLPTAVTLAVPRSLHNSAEIGNALVQALGTRTFRPYLGYDIVGSEVGGAVKNVMAIATGISEGRGLGSNARAALITRGLAEIARLSAALGGRPETINGLSGLGDLTLTCTSPQSRNMAFGLAIGRGEAAEEVLSGKHWVVEGVANAASITALAARHGVEMPICQGVDAILHHGASIDSVIRDLLERPFRPE